MVEHVVTESDNGGTVIVRQGDRVLLQVLENPSTGYTWRVVAPLEPEALDDEGFSPSSGTRIGAPGIHSFAFRAVRSGEFDVLLESDRPWRGGEAGRRFQLTIRVE
jgi:inhibitor of cysteine peptidase